MTKAEFERTKIIAKIMVIGDEIKEINHRIIVKNQEIVRYKERQYQVDKLYQELIFLYTSIYILYDTQLRLIRKLKKEMKNEI